MPSLLAYEREQVAIFGRRLLQHNLTRGTSGNLSVFDRRLQLMAISPSGIDYQQTSPEDVVVIDLEGRVAEGSNTPSSEWALHAAIYRNREDVAAAVHAHSTFSTVLSCLHWDLPALHYMIALAGPVVRCADYATFGTRQLADNALAALEDRNAVLLANHGLLATGGVLASAFHIACEIEFCAELFWRSKAVGEPVILDRDEMTLMTDKFRTYGQFPPATE